MTDQMQDAKRVSESRVVLSMMMNPEHANAFGNVHGGVIAPFTGTRSDGCHRFHDV